MRFLRCMSALAIAALRHLGYRIAIDDLGAATTAMKVSAHKTRSLLLRNHIVPSGRQQGRYRGPLPTSPRTRAIERRRSTFQAQ